MEHSSTASPSASIDLPRGTSWSRNANAHAGVDARMPPWSSSSAQSSRPRVGSPGGSTGRRGTWAYSIRPLVTPAAYSRAIYVRAHSAMSSVL